MVGVYIDYFNNKHYRDVNHKPHRDDGPAIEFSNGDKWWYINGKLHRVDGPAIEFSNGDKIWYFNGQYHRTDGPAIERASGDKEWWVNNKLHRTDGPAIEHANGDKEWWVNGQCHRIDGPAVQRAYGDKEYWYNGRILTENEFHDIVKPQVVNVKSTLKSGEKSMETNKNSYGNTLINLRKAAHLSRVKLGKQIGCSPRLIYSYEVGECKPPDKMHQALIGVFPLLSDIVVTKPNTENQKKVETNMSNVKESLLKFGLALSEERKRRNMTIACLAKKSNVAAYSIGAYERGEYWPSSLTHAKLVSEFPALANFERISSHKSKSTSEVNLPASKDSSSKAKRIEFGKELCRLRKLNKMTLVMAARALGVSIDSIRAYECGIYDPSVEIFNRLLTAYPDLKAIGYITPSNIKSKPVGNTNKSKRLQHPPVKMVKKSFHNKTPEVSCCRIEAKPTLNNSLFIATFHSLCRLVKNPETPKTIEFLQLMQNTGASLNDVIDILTFTAKQ